jgi:hypothetical protein
MGETHIIVESDRWNGFTKFRPKPEGWEGYHCPVRETTCNCGMPNGKMCRFWQPGNPFTVPLPRPSYCVKAREAYDNGEPWL